MPKLGISQNPFTSVAQQKKSSRSNPSFGLLDGLLVRETHRPESEFLSCIEQVST